MVTSLISAVVFLAVAAEPAAPVKTSSVFESSVPPTVVNQIDQIVFDKLASLNIQPVLCSDAVFVRRAYLGVIGTLPTAQEARDFIQDPDTKNKRRRLIDHLLERDEFADFWSMRWGDILRIKAEFPVNLWPNAAQAYHRWVRASIAENKPYDKFVREMLTSSGSNFRVGPVNFYRAVQNRTPEGLAGAVALAFMGARTDSWPAERLAGMSVFFSQVGYKPTAEWKEENVFWDPLKSSKTPSSIAVGKAAIVPPPPPKNAKPDKNAEKPEKVEPPPATNGQPLVAVFPDGTKVEISPNTDPRIVFADWLISPKNPWFTKSIVNRVWAWLLGRGIIHEPDDIRPDNPASNPKLLAWLEKEFVASRYDMKALYRLILNSSTYQFSSVPRFPGAKAEANFASFPLRRLDAEVLIDAVHKITGTSDLYTSAIPEPFTYIPRDKPAIALADGSVTSSFLTLFGRSARATGMENERINKPVPAQWLHMLNSSHIAQKLEQSAWLRTIGQSKKTPDEITEEIYLTVLSRFPSAEELKALGEYGTTVMPKAARQNKAGKWGSAGKTKKQGPPLKPVVLKRREDWLDIVWALINNMEFLYLH